MGPMGTYTYTYAYIYIYEFIHVYICLCIYKSVYMQTIITFLCKKLLFTERQNREITKQRGRERER